MIYFLRQKCFTPENFCCKNRQNICQLLVGFSFYGFGVWGCEKFNRQTFPRWQPSGLESETNIPQK